MMCMCMEITNPFFVHPQFKNKPISPVGAMRLFLRQVLLPTIITGQNNYVG
jgi:hypothetical protein